MYEIQFTFRNKSEQPDLFWLMEAEHEAAAIRQAFAVWQPPAEISNIQIRECKKYFQVTMMSDVRRLHEGIRD